MIKIYIFLILCVLFWSGNFIIGRYVVEDIQPLEIAFFRWFFTSIIILPIFIYNFKNIYAVFKKNYAILILLSILGISAFNTILYFGLTYTNATNALIINSSVPIIILIFSFILFKQKITSLQILGIILSTFGVLYLILKGDIKSILDFEFNNGDLLVIISSTTWALYSVLTKLKPKELSDLEYFSIIVILGLIMLLPFYLWQGYTMQSQIVLVQNNYLVFLYVSVFTSVLSYFFWQKGINTIGANKTGQFTHLMPIFGSILAYIFLGEVLEFFHIIGIILIMIGIYISIFM